ncbi:MAG: hypothetical protein K9N46_13460 [Candidatus Marinimicrobia bacterium]|nr:hypothetical protein [Candidatus Neomarinimicrobiota bacterium]MCF7829828.1 hypothetical protein [Candidatus Neomarinimicrobiota bacterium]MCF7881739.1 hypothetical protein [Candidatus Neomarinimicrobiota bacterium]
MQTSRNIFTGNLAKWKQHGLAFVIIMVAMLLYFSPVIFQNMGPHAEDTIAWKGASKSIRDYNATHDDLALWATNMFAGMPAVNISVPIAVYSVDTLIQKMPVPWTFLYFLVGGFFFYLFLRQVGLSWFVSVFGALIFVLVPHHLGLINAGHNTKMRAIMFTPLLASTFLFYVKKTSIFSFGAFTLALALMVRTNHYQIVYYSGFFLLALGVPFIIQYVQNKEWNKLGLQLGLLIGVILVAGVISAPRMVLTEQYLPYSIRGSSGETENTAQGGGLDKGYATKWSFPPEEITTFIIPNYFGGSSQYEYTGSAVPQLQGRTIPAYWGDMPFTSTTQYLGILSVFLALIGIISFWKNNIVKALLVLTVAALLISFGRHFSPVFDLFFNFMPLFDKFRAPSMILYLVRISAPILAAFGLQYVLDLDKSQWKQHLKLLGGVAGGMAVIALIPLLMGNQFELMKSMEAQQYRDQVLQMIQNARLDMLKTDAWRVLILLFFAGGALYAYLKNYLNAKVLAPILLVLMVIDMYGVDRRYLREFVPQTQTERAIQKTQVDNYIQQDTGLYRVFPVGNLFNSNRWAYFHQSVGGYHAAKMFNYQKMIEENLYQGTEQGNSINWNIVKMLNVKYLVADGQIPSEHVNILGQDPQQKWVLHEVKNPGPRAWMVYNTRVVPKASAQRQVLNQSSFNPLREAVAGSAFLSQTTTDSVAYTADVSSFDANSIKVEVETPREGLLVLSENYLPIWWEATIDGEPVEIHKVNAFQRGVVIPEGSHSVTMNIEATVFHASLISANVFLWIVHVILLIFFIKQIPAVREKLSARNSE